MLPYQIALAASAALLAGTSLSFATACLADRELQRVDLTGALTPPNPSFTPTQTIGFAGFDPSLTRGR